MKYPILLLVAIYALLGCAKFPANGVTDTTRIIFKMKVRGEINRNYVYVFPIRISTTPNPDGIGPVPVIGFPNANGLVAGNVNYFVMWTGDTQQYTLYRFDDPSLTTFTAVGVPLNPINWEEGTNTLGFELATQQLFSSDPDNVLNELQVNFLTMDYRLNLGTSAEDRHIDCLGDTNVNLNEPIRILLGSSTTYDNARSLNEPLNDCPFGDLDISDWSVEVRRQ